MGSFVVVDWRSVVPLGVGSLEVGERDVGRAVRFYYRKQEHIGVPVDLLFDVLAL